MWFWSCITVLNLLSGKAFDRSENPDSVLGNSDEILIALVSLFSTLSHFHLDHCGALPYMSEMVGYEGPIYMTHPTKAICPILLEDFRKITVDKKGETNFFTSQMIKDCMKKVVPLNLHQTVQVGDKHTADAAWVKPGLVSDTSF